MAAPSRSVRRERATSDVVAGWLDRYRPAEGARDELFGADGRPREEWLTLLRSIAVQGPQALEQRFAAAGRRIADMGVTYRAPGDSGERAWPLNRLPLLLPEAEWRVIAEGMSQRAELLDRVLADVYGDARLVAEGHLPAAAITGSPDYVRSMRGVRPPGGRWLRFYAADIGRGPDGEWWVLGDRAQAPSGAGYALQNRLVLSAAFPVLYRDMKTTRLAPFFRTFRSSLTRGARRESPRACLLTPGPWSETYAEQVALARYLGLLLVEGEDLFIEDGVVNLRTVAGPKRVDVIWRRIDADWLDPLELNAASRLGAPGLLDALRSGVVAMTNMPGSGLVESRALMSFLPRLARRVLGEDLRMPNIATWWCGQRRERDETFAALDHRAIGGAFSAATPGFGGAGPVLGADLDPPARARLARLMADRGGDYVGQEVVRLSTTPVWNDGALEPRPFALRVFAVATEDGWSVMPGGFCRVSDRLDVRAISMDAGARSADVWVLGEAPPGDATLLPSASSARVVRALGALPSRAADNLFWMSRYLERAEATLRVVRCICNRLNDARHGDAAEREPIARLEALLVSWGSAPAEKATRQDNLTRARAAVADANAPGSAIANINAAMRCAGVIRERLPQDVWQLISRLNRRVENVRARAGSELEIVERVEGALHSLAALAGLFSENFNRVAGWRFLDLGRRVERAVNTCRYTRQLCDDSATIDTLDAMLELIDSQITYRSRYLVGASITPLIDMALLDQFNPRSLRFQIDRIDSHLDGLPALADDGVPERHRMMCAKLRGDIESERADAINAARVLVFEKRLMDLAEAIGERYFTQASRPRFDGTITGAA